MQIIDNVLSVELFNACTDELREKLNSNVWASSQIVWDKILVKGFSGTTLTTKVSDLLSKQLENELSEFFPTYKEVLFMYNVWQHNSAINLHDDTHVTFGATIYLNQSWHVSAGGLFIWEDNVSKELKVLCPKQNTIVINTEKEMHLVTPVLPTTSDFRYTIQIWGN